MMMQYQYRYRLKNNKMSKSNMVYGSSCLLVPVEISYVINLIDVSLANANKTMEGSSCVYDICTIQSNNL